MAFGSVAAIAGPALGQLFGTLLGGQHRVSPGDQRNIHARNYQSLFGMLPQLDTAGMFQETRDNLERRERLNIGRQRGRARQLFGPRMRAANEATLGGSERAQTGRDVLSAGRQIRFGKAGYDQQNAQMALRGATAMLPGQVGMASLPPLGGRALAAGLQSVGQGIGARGQRNVDLANLLEMLRNPEIQKLLNLG